MVSEILSEIKWSVGIIYDIVFSDLTSEYNYEYSHVNINMLGEYSFETDAGRY